MLVIVNSLLVSLKELLLLEVIQNPPLKKNKLYSCSGRSLLLKQSPHLIKRLKKSFNMKPRTGPFCTAMPKNRNADILIRIKRIAPLANNSSTKK